MPGKKNTHIERSIRALAVPIDSLRINPANARRHPERNLRAIQASLAEFGQQKPIIVNAGGEVIAGNGTLQAARALGWRTIAAVRTTLKGRRAGALAIADNRIGELSEWDDGRLALLLKELEGEADPATIGFSQEEIAGLIGQLDPKGAGGIEDFKVQPPPAATWVLLGIPICLFAQARGPLAELEMLSGITVEVSKNAEDRPAG